MMIKILNFRHNSMYFVYLLWSIAKHFYNITLPFTHQHPNIHTRIYEYIFGYRMLLMVRNFHFDKKIEEMCLCVLEENDATKAWAYNGLHWSDVLLLTHIYHIIHMTTNTTTTNVLLKRGGCLHSARAMKLYTYYSPVRDGGGL